MSRKFVLWHDPNDPKCSISYQHAGRKFQESDMAKGQQHSKRETKKPKKSKDAPKDPASLSKGISASVGSGKKK
jgi:hypothetical protein